MSIPLVAIIRRVNRAINGSVVALTSVDLIYADGRDCGVPLLVEGYQGASELLAKLGVTSEELEKHHVKFQKDSEIRIPLVADEEVVREMGFNPREHKSREL